MAFIGLPCPKNKTGIFSVASKPSVTLRRALNLTAAAPKGSTVIVLKKSFLFINICDHQLLQYKIPQFTNDRGNVYQNKCCAFKKSVICCGLRDDLFHLFSECRGCNSRLSFKGVREVCFFVIPSFIANLCFC